MFDINIFLCKYITTNFSQEKDMCIRKINFDKAKILNRNMIFYSKTSKNSQLQILDAQGNCTVNRILYPPVKQDVGDNIIITRQRSYEEDSKKVNHVIIDRIYDKNMKFIEQKETILDMKV